MSDPTDPLILYILVRTPSGDLPSQVCGKAMAQACHASNQFIFEHMNDPLLGKNVDEWQQEANGFGTTITLAIPSLDELKERVQSAKNQMFAAGLTVDPTYPYVVNSEIFPLIESSNHTAPVVPLEDGTTLCFREETTCGYIFGRKSELADLFLLELISDSSFKRVS